MNFQNLLTTAGLLALIMPIVQYCKVRMIRPRVQQRYQKFVVIVTVVLISFGLAFIGYFLNEVFEWASDITIGDTVIHALEACFTSIVINQVWKGTKNITR